MLSENNIIEADGLGYSYTDDENDALRIPALKDVSINIKKGEYIAVLGHNGSGKSTLAKLMNLILVPSLGALRIDGKDVSSPNLPEDDVFEVRKRIGMVFQNPDNQLVATVVEEDVAFGPENLGLLREEIRRRVVDSLNMVDMQSYSRHAPHKLSGGQKQRVAIAGIIAMKPDVIIFDESTAMLDPLGRDDVVRIMELLNREEGITVINITHYMEEAARADRVIVINDGSVILDGTAREIFSEVDVLHSVGLEAPQGTELLRLLRAEGLDVRTDCLTEDECAEELIRFLSNGN